jgi:hypothetical protein
MKSQKQHACANNRRRQKIETLNRARLDAVGEVMQAYHWLDEVAATAKEVEQSLDTAHELLRRREVKLRKADRALTTYLKKESGK